MKPIKGERERSVTEEEQFTDELNVGNTGYDEDDG